MQVGSELREIGVSDRPNSARHLKQMHRNHNTMSAADHEWIVVLMQHRLQRKNSAREVTLRNQTHLTAIPVSPYSEQSRQLLRHMPRTDHTETPESASPQYRRKKSVRKSLHRRMTSGTCDSGQHSASFDIPFDIYILPIGEADDHPREEIMGHMDDLSEISIEDDFTWAKDNARKEQLDISNSSESLMENDRIQIHSNPMMGWESSWGIATLCLDDNDGWPSDECGSPQKQKKQEWRTLDGRPVQICIPTQDDQRQDSERQVLLPVLKKREGERFDGVRRNGPFVI